MRKNEEGPRSQRMSLFDLLERYTLFKRIHFSEQERLSFTLIELQEVRPVHVRKLSDRAAMRKYILQNLPVDFDETFQFRDDINRELRTHVPGFKAVRITLQSDNAPAEVVAKPVIANLQAPRFDDVENNKGEKIAFCWGCLCTEGSVGTGDQTPLGEGGPRDYQGFVYKYKGFTVGDRQQLRRWFRIGNGGLYL